MEERSFPCPNCGREVRVDARLVEGVLACPGCDQYVTIPSRASLEANAFSAKPLPPAFAALEVEAPLPDIRLQPVNPGESLSIPALLMPVFTAGLLYFGRFESDSSPIVLTLGTIFGTILLLGVDAWRLGSVDAKGQPRSFGGVMFLGMLLLWTIFYPLAFFRRRHFGRPNLGPLAIVVALLFSLAVGVEFAEDARNPIHVILPERDDLPPACDSPQVKRALEEILKKEDHNQQIQLITRHREIKIDEANKSRRGRATVELVQQRVTVSYDVTWLDRRRRTFQVRILAPAEDSRGFLGIGMQPVHGRPKGLGLREGGVFVNQVVEGRAAEQAGVQVGDIIVRVNNKSLPTKNPLGALQEQVIDLEPGTQIKLEVLRGEQRVELTITIGRRPADLP